MWVLRIIVFGRISKSYVESWKEVERLNKWANVDFTQCRPSDCDGETGICQASKACERKLMEQEDAFDSPFLMSHKMCVGCSHCVHACPLGAIKIEAGL
jgi:translation initiation factor RLI1